MKIDRYDPTEIENKWRERWERQKTFKIDLNKSKNPFYNLMMFPYPSGEGLHVGHVYAFGGSDTFGRLKRMQGKDVFEPMGFDSFGIHSENYAIRVKKHPRDLIRQTTEHFRENQLKKLGALFDWDHQVITSDSDYYKWTQWVFIQLFKFGLAVRKKAPVDWCPSCKTVLADEQVIAGRCERCATEVVQKELEQWFFKITDYAERLLKNLEWIDWSETTKQMQRNWIGRSEGVLIEFRIQDSQLRIPVFTTRADTIYGATFIVIAPEHPLAEKLTTAKYKQAVQKYIVDSKKTSEFERSQSKSGVFTGSYAVNPFTKKEIPIWIANYVLMGYGTGAIMAVPAHDQRDFEFAKKYDLPIVEVIKKEPQEGKKQNLKEAYTGEGILINSGQFSGLPSQEAIQKISKYIQGNRFGRKTVNYHLRDWLVSRQRYWGPPIPMVFCKACADSGNSWFTSKESKQFERGISDLNFKISNKSWKLKIKNYAKEMRGWYPVGEADLPVELPYIKDYQPKGTGVSPLSQKKDFVKVKCPKCGQEARREIDVSDTFLDSSWYFLRYPSVGSDSAREAPFDRELTKKWLPVDMYIGGNEHAVLHLLYARFITMALHDMGYVDFEEPFKKFRAHGLVIQGGAKMSKSRGNVVNPNQYMESYGSDTLRMYLLFIGPYELGGDFSDRAIIGVYKFLNRVWQSSLEISKSPAKSANKEVVKQINKLVKKVGDDVENLRFNTAIAALMKFQNFVQKYKKDIDIETINKLLIVLSIFAPFIAEELWSRLGNKGSIHDQSWPKVDEEILVEEEATIAIQINGKLRDTIRVKNLEVKIQDKVEKKAMGSKKVRKYLGQRKIKQVIYVPGKIINFVISD